MLRKNYKRGGICTIIQGCVMLDLAVISGAGLKCRAPFVLRGQNICKQIVSILFFLDGRILKHIHF